MGSRRPHAPDEEVYSLNHRMSSRRTSSKPRSSRKSAAPQQASQGLTRAKAVWVSFLGAMTLVGGLLLAIDGKPSPRTDGLSLSPLAAATTVTSRRLDSVSTGTRVPLVPERWAAIVIHASNSAKGDPASIEKEQQDNPAANLGHHFLIGNGNGMDDGQVYFTYRWLDQLPGKHVAGTGKIPDFYNQNAISICLVADGNRRGFTDAQIQNLQLLVDSLCKQLNLERERVVLHSDIVPGVSDPGRLFPPALFGTQSALGN